MAAGVAGTLHILELPVESVCSRPWCEVGEKLLLSLPLSPDPQGLPRESLRALLANLKSRLFLWHMGFWGFLREVLENISAFPKSPKSPQIPGFALSLQLRDNVWVLMVSDMGVHGSRDYPWRNRRPNVKVVYFRKWQVLEIFNTVTLIVSSGRLSGWVFVLNSDLFR